MANPKPNPVGGERWVGSVPGHDEDPECTDGVAPRRDEAGDVTDERAYAKPFPTEAPGPKTQP